MRSEVNMINVIIYDGNRKNNWDYPEGLSLKDVLRRRKFRWVKDSVRVNGFMIADSLLSYDLAAFVKAAEERNAYDGKLHVTVSPVEERKDDEEENRQ